MSRAEIAISPDLRFINEFKVRVGESLNQPNPYYGLLYDELINLQLLAIYPDDSYLELPDRLLASSTKAMLFAPASVPMGDRDRERLRLFYELMVILLLRGIPAKTILELLIIHAQEQSKDFTKGYGFNNSKGSGDNPLKLLLKLLQEGGVHSAEINDLTKFYRSSNFEPFFKQLVDDFPISPDTIADPDRNKSLARNFVTQHFLCTDYSKFGFSDICMLGWLTFFPDEESRRNSTAKILAEEFFVNFLGYDSAAHKVKQVKLSICYTLERNLSTFHRILHLLLEFDVPAMTIGQALMNLRLKTAEDKDSTNTFLIDLLRFSSCLGVVQLLQLLSELVKRDSELIPLVKEYLSKTGSPSFSSTLLSYRHDVKYSYRLDKDLDYQFVQGLIERWIIKHTYFDLLSVLRDEEFKFHEEKLLEEKLFEAVRLDWFHSATDYYDQYIFSILIKYLVRCEVSPPVLLAVMNEEMIPRSSLTEDGLCSLLSLLEAMTVSPEFGFDQLWSILTKLKMPRYIREDKFIAILKNLFGVMRALFVKEPSHVNAEKIYNLLISYKDSFFKLLSKLSHGRLNSVFIDPLFELLSSLNASGITVGQVTLLLSSIRCGYFAIADYMTRYLCHSVDGSGVSFNSIWSALYYDCWDSHALEYLAGRVEEEGIDSIIIANQTYDLSLNVFMRKGTHGQLYELLSLRKSFKGFMLPDGAAFDEKTCANFLSKFPDRLLQDISDNKFTEEELYKLDFLRDCLFRYIQTAAMSEADRLAHCLQILQADSPLGRFFRDPGRFDLSTCWRAIVVYQVIENIDLILVGIEEQKFSAVELRVLYALNQQLAESLGKRPDFFECYLSLHQNQISGLYRYFWINNDFKPIDSSAPIMADMNRVLCANPKLLLAKIRSGEARPHYSILQFAQQSVCDYILSLDSIPATILIREALKENSHLNAFFQSGRVSGFGLFRPKDYFSILQARINESTYPAMSAVAGSLNS